VRTEDSKGALLPKLVATSIAVLLLALTLASTGSSSAQWQKVETWTGTIEAPAAWQLVETWTGTVEAPAEWQLIETWTGAIKAPAAWQLIETWSGTVSAPAAWQLVETRTGTVEAPVAWQLIETWTGPIEAPAAWQLIETWTGTVKAPVEWQLIETWTGSVEAPAAWQLIETWTGVVEAPAGWQLVETWTGVIEAPLYPSKPTLYLPADGSITNDNTPYFEWTLGTNADNHRLLVDNNPAFTSPEENVLLGATDNTCTPTAELADENYSWKVIAINSVGENGSATWTLLIDTAPPTISGVAAANITQSSGTITWTTDEPSNSVVEYGTTTSYGSTIFDATLVTNHSITLTGLSAGTTYHYRVKSTNVLGNTATSSDYTFTTSSPPPPPPPPPDNVPPPAPSLISPADGDNITDNTPFLDWSDVSDPSGVTYDLSIARDAGFTSIVLQKDNPTASAYELTSAEALAVDTYYWHVRGVDGAGNVGSWSENWSFRVYVPPTPALTVDIPSITTDENATIEFENTAITGMTIVVGENVENVRITVQQLTDKPTEIAIGAPGVTYTYLNIVSENITDADIEIVLINFKVEKAWITAENVDPDSIVMLRWDSVAEVWVSLPTTRIGEDNTYYYYQAESPGLSIFGIGYALAPAPAEFEFSNLMINPSEVRAGETVTISVVVAHVGDLGSYNVILKIDNVVEATERVTLAGGAMRTVTFTVSSDAEGTHDIEVEGLAGTFVVTPSAPPSIVPLAITGGIVLLAGILIWLRRRRTPIVGGYPSTNGAS